MRVLDGRREALVERERALLGRLAAFLTGFGAPGGDEELSRGFVPRSDLVIFVTSADRPLTESERGYLELVRDWGKKILLVVNKADLLQEEGAAAQVRSFVEGGIRSALGLTPPLFLISALLARKAKAATSP